MKVKVFESREEARKRCNELEKQMNWPYYPYIWGDRNEYISIVCPKERDQDYDTDEDLFLMIDEEREYFKERELITDEEWGLPKMSEHIYDRQDLHRLVSDMCYGLQFDCYALEQDELIKNVADDLLDYIREEYNFKWGQSVPEIESEIFWDFFKEYEKE